MPFTLLPAVDVAGGRVARAGHGADAIDDPLAAALAWQAAGAEWIHLVDLDAAFGRGSNAELLADLIGAVDVDVELAGGIRDDTSLARALSTGCTRVVLATTALDDPGWCARAIAVHGERIAVGLDVHITEDAAGSVQHRLRARGSTHDSGDLWDSLALLDRAGCARYVVTDVGADGMLRGPNIELLHAVLGATPTPAVASGGIAEIEDLVALVRIAAARANLDGAIVGAALHAGRFTLPDALAAVRRVGA